MAGTDLAASSAGPVRSAGRSSPRPAGGPRRNRWLGPLVTQGPSLLVLGLVVLFPLAYSINMSFGPTAC